ncbi:MAG: hypothetical protein ACLU9V_07390 [Roseburia sp.]
MTTYDGRAYLQAIDEKYDVIMSGCLPGYHHPFQMSSVEFLRWSKSI